MIRIALVTFQAIPGFAADDVLLKEALERRGAQVVAAVWSDPAVDWAGFSAVIVRSTWDYFTRPAEFARWLDLLEKTGARVFNPVPLIRWNSDKRYLDELAARGVPALRTRRLAQGSATSLAQVLAEEEWDEAVLKPAISAGAFRTLRLRRAEAAAHQAALAEILTLSDALVQKFQPEVIAQGEVSLIFFNGAFSHAALKKPKPGDFRTQPQHGAARTGFTASQRLIDEAAAILVKAPLQPLYARVDGLVCEGTLRLMELELIEPDLYLNLGGDAPDRLAGLILAELGKVPDARPGR